jgi:hypothetical protein
VDVETELRYRYLGTARRKGRQQITWTYRHRATSRLYKNERRLPVALVGPVCATRARRPLSQVPRRARSKPQPTVLSKLRPENGSSTQAEKDKFKTAFGAMLDFCFTVSEHTEGRGELVLK